MSQLLQRISWGLRRIVTDSEAPGTSSQKQKQKRMAEAEDVPVVEGTVDETMAVDTPCTSSTFLFDYMTCRL